MFDIDCYLRSRRDEVEEALYRCLPAAGECPEVLADAMGHAVRTGGKRLRPILCLAAAEACCGARTAAVYPACAVELLHSYTLVHDDLPCMDNDLVRRGQPSVHAKFGEAVAVLAGDALLTLAFETLARTPAAEPRTLPLLVRELARAAGAAGVIGGQIEDTLNAGNATPELIHYVFQHKTADLFKAAMRLGAVSVNAPHTAAAKVSAYAAHLGFAFQIIDDILDQDQAAAGDKAELSCLAIMSADDARIWASEHTREAVDALEELPGDTTALAALAESMLRRVV